MQALLHPPASLAVGVNQVAVSRDTRLVATGDVNIMIRVYEGDEVLWEKWVGSHDAKVRVTQRVRSLQFSPGGEMLLVAAADRLWAFGSRTGEVLWEYTPPRSLGFLIVSPLSISISQSNEVAVSFDNGRIRFIRTDGSLIGQWKDVDVQSHVALLRDEKRMVGCDTAINVFDLYQRKRAARIRLPERAIAMSVGGPYEQVAVRTIHEVLIADLETEKIVARAKTHVGIPLVAFHPFEPIIAVSEQFGVTLMDGECRTIRQIDTPLGMGSHSRFGRPAIWNHPDSRVKVLSLTFTADGKSLKVGGSDGLVHDFPV